MLGLLDHGPKQAPAWQEVLTIPPNPNILGPEPGAQGLCR